jgi:hypothetical protein
MILILFCWIIIVIIILLCCCDGSYALTATRDLQLHSSSTTSTKIRTNDCILWSHSYLNAGGMEYDEQHPSQQRQRRPAAERPTQTLFDALGPKSIPAK